MWILERCVNRFLVLRREDSNCLSQCQWYEAPTHGQSDFNIPRLCLQVIASKLWRSIAAALALPDSRTDYAFRLRLHYVNHLYPLGAWPYSLQDLPRSMTTHGSLYA